MTYLPTPTSNDTSGISSGACVPASGSSFYVNTNTIVNCTATDKVGNVNSCFFNVSVYDYTPPTIKCPANMSVLTTSNSLYQAVTYTFTATDTSGILNTSCNYPSGSIFTWNTTTLIVCTTYDNAYLQSSCNFTIYIYDNTHPTLNLPVNDINVNITNGYNTSAFVTFSASATSGSGIQSFSCVPPSNSWFPYGMTYVTCSARSNALRYWSGTFSVTVTDAYPPTPLCPSNIYIKPTTLTAGTPSGAASFSFAATAAAGVNRTNCSAVSGSQFMLGVTPVTCTAWDNAILSASCTFNVTVSNSNPPSIQCPSDKLLNPTTGIPSVVATYASSQSDPIGVLTTSCDPPSGSSFNLGTTTNVTCTAINTAFVAATCMFYISVQASGPPNITCPTVMNLSPNTTYTAVTYSPAPNATDGCGIASLTCTPPSGSIFTTGQAKSVTCTATNYAALTKSCTFTVSIADVVPPNIACPSSISAGPGVGQTSAVVNFQQTVSDNVAIKSTSCSPPSGSSFSLGQTNVSCLAIDSSNNQAQCYFSVTVADKTPPVLYCSGDVTGYCDPGSPTGQVYWPNAFATSLLGTPSVFCLPAYGTTIFNTGVTPITCTATDPIGNTASCEFNITMIDSQPPMVTCPVSITDTLSYNAGTKVEYWNVGSSDNVAVQSVNCAPAIGSSFGPGITTVTCVAHDTSGNTASCNFQLSLLDTQPPNIQCPAMYIGSTSVNQSTGIVVFTEPSTALGTASDNVAVTLVTCTRLLSNTNFSLGLTTITCTAFDSSGNTASCSFGVNIVDNQKPVLTCPANMNYTIPVSAGSSVKNATIIFPALTAPVDNVGVVSSSLLQNGFPISAANFPTVFPLGRTIFTYSATDAQGNTGT